MISCCLFSCLVVLVARVSSGSDYPGASLLASLPDTLIMVSTLVYGALSVLLAGTHVAAVVGIQALLLSFTGGSNLAIAVSTLAVAALFMPVHSWVQHFVDRRFYRRRYDTRRTLDAFGARLREHVELELALRRVARRRHGRNAAEPRVRLAEAGDRMSARRARWLAWGLVAWTVAIFSSFVWLLVLNVHSDLDGDVFTYSGALSNTVPAVAFVAVGFLIASRKPDNPIGWLLLVTSPIFGMPLLAQQYAAYVLLAGHPGLPFGRAVAVALNGLWIPGTFVLIMLLLLFPTGRLVSPRWRVAAWLSATSLGLLMFVSHAN